MSDHESTGGEATTPDVEPSGPRRRAGIVVPIAVVVALLAIVVVAVTTRDSDEDDAVGSRENFTEVVVERILDACGISPNAEYIIDDELYLRDDPIENAPEGSEEWVVEIYLPSFDATAYMIVRRLADGRFGNRVYDRGCP